ncbi:MULTISPECIES: cupin [Pandoraea]|uniref:cupin n=1 Tax=Pandoraea TaxID=93217 RepID=UPI001F5C8624|nr:MULTISPECIES: cupin [Pandoraea]
MSEFDRRNFMRTLSVLGLTGLGAAFPELAARAATVEPDSFILQRNGWVPNNPQLPVLHYRQVMTPDEARSSADRFERLVGEHGWPAQWRAGIYDYHHYHSTAHEVLFFVRGSVELVLGGPGGRRVSPLSGDVVVLPTGTGHMRVSASNDLLVVGAYPRGQQWDVCTSAPTAEMSQRMQSLPFPQIDPVTGTGGPLTRLWTRA